MTGRVAGAGGERDDGLRAVGEPERMHGGGGGERWFGADSAGNGGDVYAGGVDAGDGAVRV